MGPSGRLIEEKKPQDSVRELIKQEMTEALQHMRRTKKWCFPPLSFW